MTCDQTATDAYMPHGLSAVFRTLISGLEISTVWAVLVLDAVHGAAALISLEACPHEGAVVTWIGKLCAHRVMTTKDCRRDA